MLRQEREVNKNIREASLQADAALKNCDQAILLTSRILKASPSEEESTIEKEEKTTSEWQAQREAFHIRLRNLKRKKQHRDILINRNRPQQLQRYFTEELDRVTLPSKQSIKNKIIENQVEETPVLKNAAVADFGLSALQIKTSQRTRIRISASFAVGGESITLRQSTLTEEPHSDDCFCKKCLVAHTKKSFVGIGFPPIMSP